jgi:GNAT superfamily N-acetyltransferase
MNSKKYPDYQSLFENHLAFLSSHRGTVNQDGDCFYIESSRKEFTYAVLGTDEKELGLLDRFSIQHLTPWSSTTEQELLKSGFHHQGGLSYMELPENGPAWKLNSQLNAQRITNEQDMATFSEVQGRGFISNEEAYQDWMPWLHHYNLKNLYHSDQSFYVGYLDQKPVGCALLVKTQGTAGIYAVATLPNFRKLGVSTTIMHQLIETAKHSGCKQITLQVVQGSYAEKFYEKLGFQTAFQVKVYARR